MTPTALFSSQAFFSDARWHINMLSCFCGSIQPPLSSPEEGKNENGERMKNVSLVLLLAHNTFTIQRRKISRNVPRAASRRSGHQRIIAFTQPTARARLWRSAGHCRPFPHLDVGDLDNNNNAWGNLVGTRETLSIRTKTKNSSATQHNTTKLKATLHASNNRPITGTKKKQDKHAHTVLMPQTPHNT